MHFNKVQKWLPILKNIENIGGKQNWFFLCFIGTSVSVTQTSFTIEIVMNKLFLFLEEKMYSTAPQKS